MVVTTATTHTTGVGVSSYHARWLLGTRKQRATSTTVRSTDVQDGLEKDTLDIDIIIIYT